MAIIIAAIPFFLLLIAIELWFDHKRKTHYYRFNDAINSLSIGILSRFTGVLKSLIPLSIYWLIYQKYALFDLPKDSIWVWIFAFVVYDLAYYWAHRLNHRIHVMWGSHVVHHSSEEYNLTTALRQTSSPSLLAWLVYLPIALIGVDPVVFIACASLNLVYQFWVHTRHVDKMPAWFEAIMVTPSHHRVHHALNRDYIDKNYAGVFIIWDKLFNSFQAEKDEVDIVYGVSHQLKSWNPFWANLQVYWNLIKDAYYARSWKDKFKVFFMPPGWRPEDVNADHPRKYATTKTLIKYEVSLPTVMKVYILCQFVLILALTITFLLTMTRLSVFELAIVGAFASINLVLFSGLQELKSWILWVEPVRLMFLSLLFYILLVPLVSWHLESFLIGITLVELLAFYKTVKLTMASEATS
ncbi:sterol desaturase family protein [Thalassotalea sp. LPB0316]|uniref:sterol desaturase family protein n=1 Tax=Thalassotalea sp. LPB0316 TaxID=2769490 RepID=UPI001865E397|nr:sterol desaturase family protein [Thalassotalea sp. LPB0316]QOL24514.1 sterol desaturase family protein [Thalassotalea sp. LPB0316]